MSLKTYLRIALLLTAIDAVLLGYLYSAGLENEAVRAFFILKGALDSLFVIGNWGKSQPTRFEVGLMAVISVHAIAGLFVLPMLSSEYLPTRAINDVIWPVLFLAKIVIIRNLIVHGGLSAEHLKFLVRATIFLSVAQIIIFVVVSRTSGAYAGVTPPINLGIAFGLAFSSPLLIALSLVVILLSGKRSFLLAAVVAIAMRALIQRKNRGAFLTISGLVVMVLIVAIVGYNAGILPEGIDGKLKQTAQILEPISIVFREGLGTIFDDTVRYELYISTAGRSEEFFAIFSAMRWYNIFVGLGAGFTYSFMHLNGWIDGYANTHFSPLTLTYKFGIVYAVCLYAYVFRGIVSLIRSSDKLTCMVGFGLVMFLVQSFFAFNLFVELFLPFLVALRQVVQSPVTSSPGTAGYQPVRTNFAGSNFVAPSR